MSGASDSPRGGGTSGHSGQAIPLGPFDVIEPIGKGGMAEVWRGVHRRQNVPVAVKFVTGPWAQNPVYIETFRNEIRAIAGVDHPGIVMIFDHGEVGEETWAASGGQLRRGTPYIVMELASGGALDEVDMPLSWPDLKGVLLTLLDALAHAHARGIVHRDLKPANVLLCKPDDVRPGLKLTDFGIAHAMRRDDEGAHDELTEGTPEYMAPEQCRAMWRDYGPWTDLYALGCLAYELACGEPPFMHESATMVFIHQIDSEPPKLDLSKLGLPQAFEGWLWRLLQKDIDNRFRVAADAAWALAQIGEDDATPGKLLASLGVSARIQGTTLRDTMSQARGTLLGAAPRVASAARNPSVEAVRAPLELGHRAEGITLCARKPPPLPDTWRRPAEERWSMALVGTGLGLYGLRALRLVDRDGQREAMWEALRKTGELGRAHLFLLHGAAGNGKSALAHWLCQRAAEVGGAHIMVGYHSQRPGSGDGVPRMVAQYLQCVGLDRAQMLQRVEAKLRAQGVTDPYEWNALTELMTPATEHDWEQGAQKIRFGSREEGYALVRRLLKRIARDRPVVVWLDDIHWSEDSVDFARYLMVNQATDPVSALLLVTARDEALIELPEMMLTLRQLTEVRGARDMPIGVLEKRDRAALVQQLLGLEGRLAAQVEERTEGNPLFAVQLVGDWVQRGVLEVGPRGFVLRPGAEAVLPNDLYQFWTARIGRLLQGNEDQEPALQVAAILGRIVDPKEWVAACEEAGIVVDVDILSRLFRERLAAPQDGGAGWSYTHGVLRETFERRARESGRWPDYHRAAVRMLRMMYPPYFQTVQERIGRHLFEAGEYEEALEPLLAAAGTKRIAGEYTDAHRLLALRDEAMRRADIADSDERWGQSWVLASWISSNQGRIGDAAAYSERAERSARTFEWPAILPQALLGLSVAARDKGELARANTLTDEAFFLYEALGNQIGMAHCLQGSGVIARLRGDTDWAQTQTIRALNLHERVGNAFGVAQCKQRLAEAVLCAGRLDEAKTWLQEAITAYDEIAAPLGKAHCYNGLGDAARFGGDVAGAEPHYRAAKQIFSQLGSTALAYTTERLGLVALVRGKYRRARELLNEAREVFGTVERAGDAWRVSAELLPCAAAFKDWSAWDEYARDIEHLTGDTPHVDPDIATCAGWAGRLAANAADVGRARVAYALEVSQWRALGRDDLAAKAQAAADELADAD